MKDRWHADFRKAPIKDYIYLTYMSLVLFLKREEMISGFTDDIPFCIHLKVFRITK